MIILCDIDNVVINTTEAVIAQYNEECNDNLVIDDVKSYWMEQYVKPEHRENFFEFFLMKETWKRAKAINVEAVQWLIDNHEVYFVTATQSDNVKKKSNFLKRTFKNIDVEDRLIKANHKELVMGDIIIDDYPKNLETSPCAEKVCIAYPWNSDYNGERFSSVSEYILKRFGVQV